MSRKYKFVDNSHLYFVTLTIVGWIDLFIRNEYRDVIIRSISYCQQAKDLEVYGWCLMTSHLHMIIGSKGNDLSNIMRDLKRNTSETLHQMIRYNKLESRRQWILKMMENINPSEGKFEKYRLWQPESHPIEIRKATIAYQKLAYMHFNPVESGFVINGADWPYSSAIDYDGGKGLLDIIKIEPMTISI